MTSSSRRFKAVLIVLAALAGTRHAAAQYRPIAEFSDGASAELDEGATERLLFKTPEGRLKRGVLLPGKLLASAHDERFVAVLYKRAGAERVAVYGADGKALADAATLGKANFMVYSNPQRVVLARVDETFVLDRAGKLLCHEHRPGSAGVFCGSDEFAAAISRGDIASR